jgi:hypothetical protein
MCSEDPWKVQEKIDNERTAEMHPNMKKKELDWKGTKRPKFLREVYANRVEKGRDTSN